MPTLSRSRLFASLVGVLCAIGIVVAPVASAANDHAHAKSARGAEHAAGRHGHGNANGHAKHNADRAAAPAAAPAQSHAASAAKAHKAAKADKADKAARQHPATPASQGQGHGPTTAPKDKADSSEEHVPAGNKGSMKVRPVGTPAAPPRNYAHLPCVVQVDFYGVPHSSATVTAVSHAPTGPTGQTLLTQTLTFSQSSPNPPGNELVGSTTLDFTGVLDGLTYHAQQGYHVKLTAEIDGPQGANVKHKVFWIDCAAPAVAPAPQVQEPVIEGETPVEHDGAEAVEDAKPTPVAPAAVDGAVLGVHGERVVGAPAATADAAIAPADGSLAARVTRSVLAATGIPAGVLALMALVVLAGGVVVLRRTRRV
jgi:hypothetical protein